MVRASHSRLARLTQHLGQGQVQRAVCAAGMSSTFVKVSDHNGKPAVEVGNAAMSIKVITSGGNVVWAGAPGVGINPLWTPEWDTVPSSLRRVAARDAEKFSQAAEDLLESELLSCIGGHNLCCDVFGAHSEGEVKNAGLSFHGEAGLREWEVTHVDDTSVTMSCHLRQSQLEVTRTYTPAADGAPVIKVTEKLKNLVGSDRCVCVSHLFPLPLVSSYTTDAPSWRAGHWGARST